MISLSIPGPGDNTIGVGPLELRASAVMIAIGVVVAVRIARRRWATRRGNGDDIAERSVWAVPAVGARLHQVITDWHRLEGGWWHAPAVWEGGLGHARWSDRRSAGRGAAAFHPTFTYEAARNLVLDALLVAIERRWRPRPGQLFAGHVAGYAAGAVLGGVAGRSSRHRAVGRAREPMGQHRAAVRRGDRLRRRAGPTLGARRRRAAGARGVIEEVS